MADHVYESGRENSGRSGRSFDPTDVKNGDIIFVEAGLLDAYFKDIHPLIRYPYKLITHNNDWNITEKEIGLIDEKIIHWFAQNVLIAHPKVTPVPIGLENAHYANAGYAPLYEKPLPSADTRSPRILVGFNTVSNPKERALALEVLSKASATDILKKRYEQPEYVSVVKKYCFVASPPGNGEDCIRTWETMLLGAIPIVKRSVSVEYFDSLHLPLWIIDSWTELRGLSDYDLRMKYDLITSQADRKPLYMDYWSDIIKTKN
jgi:hypothetical protein